MKKIVKVTAICSGCFLLIILLIMILMPFWCRIDENGDGKKDFKAYTNILYLIREYDFDADENYDLKEYVNSNRAVEKIVVLSKKYDDLEITQTFRNGTKCTLSKANNHCDPSGIPTSIVYTINGKEIKGIGGF